MAMVMTVLEARVAPDRKDDLLEAYEAAIQEDEPGLVQTFLAHTEGEPERWFIMTVWESREALMAMRSTGQTPRGVLIFRAAGAVPALSILEVAAHRPPEG